jgi:NAD(P)-dependent dehydrogenase (short-subunit alcohol dehydrogenase family)
VKVAGKKVVVTGGASGIGESSVQRFVAEGAAVAILDLDETRGRALADELAASGGVVLFRRTDVTVEVDVRAAVDEVVSAFGGIDVLHANAGAVRAGTATDLSEADWDFVYAVNVKAPWLCAKHVLPHLVARGGGAIVITGSTSGLVGFPGAIAYTSSKGAVINLTRSLALEHAEQGVRVNCVCPGHIDTPMSRAYFEDPDDPSALEAGFGMLASQLPVKRMGTPEEVAAFCVFLASDDAGFCTGGIYVCDGGLTAQ